VDRGIQATGSAQGTQRCAESIRDETTDKSSLTGRLDKRNEWAEKVIGRNLWWTNAVGVD